MIEIHYKTKKKPNIIIDNDISIKRSIETAWKLVNQNQPLCIETTNPVFACAVDRILLDRKQMDRLKFFWKDKAISSDDFIQGLQKGMSLPYEDLPYKIERINVFLKANNKSAIHLENDDCSSKMKEKLQDIFTKNKNEKLIEIETVGTMNLLMIDEFAQQFNTEIHFYDENGTEFTIQDFAIKEQRPLQEFENWIYRDEEDEKSFRKCEND